MSAVIVPAERVAIARVGASIGRMVREHPDTVRRVLQRHGSTIEEKAAEITPVDKGFLRRANTHRVEQGAGTVSLTVENRMVYAPYQHNRVLHHTQPKARDHFISIPFAAEIPYIVRDIVKSDMEALNE